MLHMSIIQNNFLNKNLSTLTVQKKLLYVYVLMLCRVKMPHLLTKWEILPRSKLILNTLLFFKIVYKLGFTHFNI